MLSGHNNEGVHVFTLQQQTQDFANVVNQGIPRGICQASVTRNSNNISSGNHGKESRGRRRTINAAESRTINAAESHDSTIMYLVMPSYAEPYKKEIKQILLNEKNNLCNSKTF